jgi:hypothetical protein
MMMMKRDLSWCRDENGQPLTGIRYRERRWLNTVLIGQFEPDFNKFVSSNQRGGSVLNVAAAT